MKSMNNHGKEWNAISKMEAAPDKQDVDISNLNADSDFVAPTTGDEESEIALSKEEKDEMRKKLFFLLIFIIIILIVFVGVLISNTNKSGKEESNKKDEQSEKVDSGDENNKPSEVITEKTLADLPMGTLDIQEKAVRELFTFVDFQTDDFYVNNPYALYYSNKSITTIDDNSKLFLFTKTEQFTDLLGMSNGGDICSNNNIVINNTDLDTALNTSLMTSVHDHKNFSYLYNYGANDKKVIKFINDGQKYIGTCTSLNSTILSKVTDQELISATKTQDAIILNAKVVFINKSGVYKDPAFKSLITNDFAAIRSDYINSGNTYKYIFKNNNGKYYLTSVELVK